ncbi:hypothetical protein Hdeb2414_s0008g00292801 [Helianthus debilis subsp. tardiflorus]
MSPATQFPAVVSHSGSDDDDNVTDVDDYDGEMLVVLGSVRVRSKKSTFRVSGSDIVGSGLIGSRSVRSTKINLWFGSYYGSDQFWAVRVRDTSVNESQLVKPESTQLKRVNLVFGSQVRIGLRTDLFGFRFQLRASVKNSQHERPGIL